MMNQVQKEIQLLQGIDTVIVRVRDIATSKEWYTGRLGLKPIWEDPAMGLVVLDTNSPVSLTLWQTDQELNINKDTASYPIFRTPDAEALRRELLSRKIEAGEVVKDDHVTYFFFYDPDGNVLEACQVHG
jgi:catechol 2,3-dioxygenase-like lactoylglutathione lyase family enzyme